jgi:hypothetical protein
MPIVSLDLTKNLLTNMPTGAKLEATKLSTGEIMVTTLETYMQTKEDILKERYEHLLGKTITVTEAAEKYQVPRSTLQSWIYRSGYIQINQDSYPQTVNEAEVAYCVDIYRQRRAQGSKAPLLDDDGSPYELKHPDLFRYRQNKKQTSG